MHWHTGYPEKTLTPTIKQLQAGAKHPRREPMKSFDRHLRGWGVIAKDAKKLGIEIINVNPKSGIKAFKKMALSKIMNEESNESKKA